MLPTVDDVDDVGEKIRPAGKSGVGRVITYREIKDVLEKIKVLDGHISHLTEVMSAVSQLSDDINTVNDGLAADRRKFNSEIRSVEVLQDILRKHVYQPVGGARGDLPQGSSEVPGANDIAPAELGNQPTRQ